MKLWRALCIVLALSPTYLIRFHVGSVPFTVFEILILFVSAWACVRFIMSASVRAAYAAQVKKISWVVWTALFVFVIAGVVSVFIAPDVRAALGIFRAYIVEALCVGALIFLEYREPQQIYELIAWSSLTVFAISVYAIFQMVTGFGIPNPYWAAAASRRATSIFGYPNAIGLYVEFLIPLLIGAGFLSHGRTRAWFWGVTFFAIVAFLCGKSAGATAAVGGTTLLYLLVWKRTRARTVMLIALCAFLIVATPLRKPFAQQFLFQGFSGGLRIQMWKETAIMLKERPVQGAGLAGYQARVAPFHVNKHVEIYLYPHNLFLTLWSELGLCGMISFFIIFIWVAARLWRARTHAHTREAHVWILCTLAIFSILFIHGIVDIPYFKNDFAAWYWAIVALGLQLGYTKIS